MPHILLQGITCSRIVVFLLSCTVIFPSIFSGIIYPDQNFRGTVVAVDGSEGKVLDSRSRASVVIFEDDMETGGDAANGLWVVTELVDEGSCEPWAIETSRSHSATHSWWIDDNEKRTAEVLDTPSIVIPPRVTAPELRFWHYVDTESSYDGGWLQYRKDGGAWIDIQKNIITKNAYNDRIGYHGSGIPSGVEKQAWSGKPYGAFSEVVVDLSSLNLAGHSLRIRWRFESDGDAAGNGWWVDDVKVTVEPRLNLEKSSIGSSESSLFRYNGTTNISGIFYDFPGYDHVDYQISMVVRGPDLKDFKMLDNQTHGNQTLNIVKLSPGNFTFSFELIPLKDLAFGRYDISVSIRNVNGWYDSVSFDENDGNFTLLSVPPFFRNETVNFTGESINVLDHRGIPLSIVFHDPDAQNPNDFSMDLYLSRPPSKVPVFENLSNRSGLNVSMGAVGVYNVSYVWYPDTPEEIMEGTYEIELILREGDEYEITLEMFGIVRNTTVMRKSLPDILSLSATPNTVNVSGSASTILKGNFLDPDTFNPDDFKVTFKIRDMRGAIVIITESGINGDQGISIVKEGATQWVLTCSYDPPDDLPLGSYDLYLGVADGESPIVSTGFENNTDELQLYSNTNPIIEEVECSVTRLNIYGEDSCRFSAVFSDVDHESMGNFSAHLNLMDPEGNVHILLGGPGVDVNESVPYLSPLDGSKYVFRYDIDPPSHLKEGKYLISFAIWDGWQGRDSLTFGEIGINLTLFYNSFPSPPMKIWPNSTTNTFPLISWWGALDEETPYDKLKYWVQIGTSQGDDSILPWYNTNFSTSYRPPKELSTGVYYIQVRCFDGEYYSDALEIAMTITRTGNSPPGIPGPISPHHTIRQDPAITWGASTDGDENDLIEYFISIGTDWHSSDIMKSIPTSVNTFYQLPFKLDYGTYYVQVSANDGYEFSPVREQTMIIFDPTDNVSPFPPTSLEPRVTRNPQPFISWSGFNDLNDDELFFWLRIGTSSGNGEVLPWSNTGKNSFFQLDELLSVGRYYFQVKCFDGTLFSDIFETTVDILPPHPLLPPTGFDPSFTTDTTPLVKWSGASYLDGIDGEGNFSYLIRIGANETSGDVLPWTYIYNKTYYQLVKELWPGKTVFVQIKTFDGILYSNVSVWTLEVTEFRLTIGFNVTNYMFILEKKATQTLSAFIKNHGNGDLTVTLSVTGSLSAYVDMSESSVTIGRGELVSISLTLNVPSSLSVDENSQIVLTVTSLDGAVASSVPLSFERVVVKDEGWNASLDGNYPFLIGISILIFTLILLMILIVKRFKKGRRERASTIFSMKDDSDEEMQDDIAEDQYSNEWSAPRRSLKRVDVSILDTLRIHGMVSGKKRLKVTFQSRRVPLSLTAGARNSKSEHTRALPPPPPGEVSSSPTLTDYNDQVPPMVDIPEPVDESDVENINRQLPGPPDDPLPYPRQDALDEESLFTGSPFAPEMDYLPPESSGIINEEPGTFSISDVTDAFYIESDPTPPEDANGLGFISTEIEDDNWDELPGDEVDEGTVDGERNEFEEGIGVAMEAGLINEGEDEKWAGANMEVKDGMEGRVNIEREAEAKAGSHIEVGDEMEVGGHVEAEVEMDTVSHVEAEDGVEAGVEDGVATVSHIEVEDEKEGGKGTAKTILERGALYEPGLKVEENAEESTSALDDIMGILGIDEDEEA